VRCKGWETAVRRASVASLLLTALAVGGCTYPGASTPMPNPSPALVSLWDAFRRADLAVRSEAPDAKLVSASAQWQAVDAERLLEGTPYWVFVFYSATQRSVFDVSVDAGGARVVNRVQVWVAPDTLELGAWREGPRDALSVFLAYSGREFLEEHPGATVSLHLAAGEERKGVWSVAFLDPESRETVSIQVDAETLEILFVSP